MKPIYSIFGHGHPVYHWIRDPPNCYLRPPNYSSSFLRGENQTLHWLRAQLGRCITPVERDDGDDSWQSLVYLSGITTISKTTGTNMYITWMFQQWPSEGFNWKITRQKWWTPFPGVRCFYREPSRDSNMMYIWSLPKLSKSGVWSLISSFPSLKKWIDLNNRL